MHAPSEAGRPAWLSPSTRWHGSAAGGAIACLVLIELLALTTWLDTDTLRAGSGLVRIVADLGPTLLRCAVAAVVMSLVFRGSQAGVRPEADAAAAAADRHATGGWLAAHGAAVIAFVVLSFELFQGRLPERFDRVLAAAWLAAGAGAGAAVAFAWQPPAFWLRQLRGHWRWLALAAAAGAGAWGLGALALDLWRPMSRATLTAAAMLLHPLVPGATIDPATFRIGTPAFSVLVSRECSGLESLGLMLVFTTAWLWLHRAEWRFPRALLIVPVGMALVWVRTACASQPWSSLASPVRPGSRSEAFIRRPAGWRSTQWRSASAWRRAGCHG